MIVISSISSLFPRGMIPDGSIRLLHVVVLYLLGTEPILLLVVLPYPSSQITAAASLLVTN